jgi:hypothetical protein
MRRYIVYNKQADGRSASSVEIPLLAVYIFRLIFVMKDIMQRLVQPKPCIRNPASSDIVLTYSSELTSNVKAEVLSQVWTQFTIVRKKSPLRSLRVRLSNAPGVWKALCDITPHVKSPFNVQTVHCAISVAFCMSWRHCNSLGVMVKWKFQPNTSKSVLRSSVCYNCVVYRNRACRTFENAIDSKLYGVDATQKPTLISLITGV